MEGIKTDLKEIKVIMDLGKNIIITVAREIIVTVQWYRDTGPIKSHVIAPPKEAASEPKGRNTIMSEDT